MTDAPAQDAQHASFRQHLPDLSTPRFTRIAECDAHMHAAELLEHHRPPWLFALVEHWRRLLKEPFRGVTTDGAVRPGLFRLRDEGVEIEKIVEAANGVVGQLSEAQRAKTLLHIDSEQWRTWSNPEFLISDKGVRLDDVSPELRDAVMGVLRASLSPEGYTKAVGAMRVNGYLGELFKAERVMNEWSYNFVLFGTPDAQRPWGWSFYGHHLCLNVFFYGRQIVISPWFTGAEPNFIDQGPWANTRILDAEERLGLELMQSLTPDQQARARTYEKMKDDKMPWGRWNHDDQRHLAGAYRDNRVIPYEGILASELSDAQKQTLRGILEQYLLYLPKQSRDMKIADCEEWYKETYFSWIGGFGDTDAFYFRIQSPVILVEFDHHSGVFLNNTEPAKFHIHTLLRTPNGGDYGYALRGLGEGVKQEFIWEG